MYFHGQFPRLYAIHQRTLAYANTASLYTILLAGRTGVNTVEGIYYHWYWFYSLLKKVKASAQQGKLMLGKSSNYNYCTESLNKYKVKKLEHTVLLTEWSSLSLFSSDLCFCLRINSLTKKHKQDVKEMDLKFTKPVWKILLQYFQLLIPH